jgi:hypothetical protein
VTSNENLKTLCRQLVKIEIILFAANTVRRVDREIHRITMNTKKPLFQRCTWADSVLGCIHTEEYVGW